MKSTSLRNFAHDFDDIKRHKDPNKKLGKNYFVPESDIGGKGGRASRGQNGEFKTEEDLVKERR